MSILKLSELINLSLIEKYRYNETQPYFCTVEGLQKQINSLQKNIGMIFYLSVTENGEPIENAIVEIKHLPINKDTIVEL